MVPGNRYDSGRNSYVVRISFKEVPEVYDLTDFLDAIFNLHNRVALVYSREPNTPKISTYTLKYPRKYLKKDETLRISRIEIHSPGFIDFVSTSVAIIAIAKFLVVLIKYYREREGVELKNLLMQTELYDTLRKKGLSDEEIDWIFRSSGLKRKVYFIDRVEPGNRD